MKKSARKRILMLLENNPFPQDTRVRQEAAALHEAGYQVSVIGPKGPGQSWRENFNGVQVYRFWAPNDANGLLGYLWEYGYSMAAVFLLSLVVLSRDGFDVVHAHNPPDTFVFIGAFYKLLGKRFVFDHHDLAPEMYCARFEGHGSSLLYHTLIALEKWSCRLADRVITTNQSYKRMAMKRARIAAERIIIVRNGPDMERIKPVEPDPELRAPGKLLIGYMGIMGVQDGVDYLLRALRHLAYGLARDDFLCILIGEGNAWNSMKQLATELHLDAYVRFTGRLSDADLIRYLAAVDICVDPDPLNPFNDRSTMIKMTEYMALGKPIVAFDLAEHRFTAQAAAVYVRCNDEKGFARSLARLMDDPARREAMGACGRQRIEKELAWHHSIPKLLEAYRGVT